MKQNIGIVNAYARITCGLTMIAWSTAKMTRRPIRSCHVFTTLMGAMKVAEGITRYCPVTELVNKSEKFKDIGLDDIAKNNVNNEFKYS